MTIILLYCLKEQQQVEICNLIKNNANILTNPISIHYNLFSSTIKSLNMPSNITLNDYRDNTLNNSKNIKDFLHKISPDIIVSSMFLKEDLINTKKSISFICNNPAKMNYNIVKVYKNISDIIELVKNQASSNMSLVSSKHHAYANPAKKIENEIETLPIQNTSHEHEFKLKYRQICMTYLKDVAKIKLPSIRQGLQNEAVLIEYRELPHTELLIRNAIIHLGPEWSFTVVCGSKNYKYFLRLCMKISTQIKIINTGHENMTQNDYSEFLCKSEFWNLLTGDKILIYQEDTCIFNSAINQFMHWDYIGAPLVLQSTDNQVGNGGLSLRTRQKMLDVIAFMKHDKFETTLAVKKWMETVKMRLPPEDVYFSQVMQKHKIGKVADINSAKLFSTEKIFQPNTFGMHAFWQQSVQWEEIIHKHFKYLEKNHADISYYGLSICNSELHYLEKMSEYEKLTKLTKDAILNDPKQEYRYFGYRYTNYLRNIELHEIQRGLENETVLIEFRVLHNIEFILRNTIRKLGPNWSHTIVCGNLNYNFINEICKKISQNINIVKLNFDNINIDEYSTLLASVEFWHIFSGSKILIYQEDTCIFNKNIDKFLQYDYVGAPWPKEYKINSTGVGNGGLSLRTKSVMIDIINTCDFFTYKPSKRVNEYMKQQGLKLTPEDVYFSDCITKYGLGKISTYEDAFLFSSESFASKDSFGGHQFWLSDKNWKSRLYKDVIVQFKPTYNIAKNTHRGGWKDIIVNFVKNDLYNDTSNIIFYDTMEIPFLWDKKHDVSCEWCGIIHCTNNTPPYLDMINIDNLFKSHLFLSALEKCKFIVVLSNNNKIYLENRFKEFNKNVPVIMYKHPINHDKSIPPFNIESYESNKNKKIIQIGQQLRKITSIYKINTNMDKLWLTGTKDFDKVRSLFIKEKEYLNITNINQNDVKWYYTETYKEYDNLLMNNIVFIDLFDAAANNVVLECILRGTPIIVNKLPGVVDYLGEKYPMYFNDITDINHLTDIKLIKKTNEYLLNLKLDTVEEFYKNILNTVYTYFDK